MMVCPPPFQQPATSNKCDGKRKDTEAEHECALSHFELAESVFGPVLMTSWNQNRQNGSEFRVSF